MRTALAEGLLFRFTAKGYSMSPFIKNDDVLTVAPASRHALRLGDVAVFIHPVTRDLCVHRIVGVMRGNVLVKADNGFDQDGVIRLADILGVIVYVQRGKTVISWGLGIERVIIAFLSRVCFFPLVLYPLRRGRAYLRNKAGRNKINFKV